MLKKLCQSAAEVWQSIILECFGIGGTRERNTATISAMLVFMVRLVFTRVVIYLSVALVHCYYVIEEVAPIFKN